MKFCDFHPILLLLFFTSVITLNMFLMNPFILFILFTGAASSVIYIEKRWTITFYMIVLFCIFITNPLFSHNGKTVLFFLFDQRITLEAFVYGLAAGVKIAGVMLWFKLFGIVFKEDKLTWIIGKISPKLTVIFCMILRFIPLFTENAKNIYNAQISMKAFDTSTIKGKSDLCFNVLSALISLSVENAVETADIMKTRGFENTKRSSYTLVRLSIKDISLSLIIILADICIINSLYNGYAEFLYYPKIKFEAFSAVGVFFYTVYIMISFIPLINDMWEDLRWKYLISKI